MTDRIRNIINSYADRIAEAHTLDAMKDISVALLAHISFLLGRESLRSENEEGADS